MKIKELKESMEIYEYIYSVEFEGTLDEGWLLDNDSLEAQTFKTLSGEGKVVYAMAHAKAYALNVMEWTIKEFEDYYGNINDYF